MIIVKEDIFSVIYGEIIDEITRENDDLVTEKIAIGTGEVLSYLNRFDTDLMFGADWQEPFFKSLCVAVIAWKLNTLCGPNINLDIIRTGYEDAIKTLQKVQDAKIKPAWPMRPNDPETNIDDAGNIQYSSNQKRSNHY